MSDEKLRELERRAETGGAVAARQLFLERDRAGLCTFHAETKAVCRACQCARNIDWGSLFREDADTKCEGATPHELARLDEDLRRAISPDETKRLMANLGRMNLQGIIDPSCWTLPEMPVPPSFKSFLAWSNGGNFVRGSREFGFFGTTGIRDYLLGYSIPQWMPGATPFAFDGGGTFYLFDMRRMPLAGEYPVLFAHAGSLGYDGESCWRVADGFLAACEGTTDPHEDRSGPRPTYPERADIWLVAEPRGGMKGLIAVKEALALTASIRTLKVAFDRLPARVLHDVPFFPNAVRCARYIRRDPCLEVRAVDRPDTLIDVSALGVEGRNEALDP